MLRWHLLLLLVGSSWGQRANPGSTPCPNVCQYFWDDKLGQWQGLITIIPPVELSQIDVDIQMTVTYYPLVAGYGNIDVYGGEDELHAITRRVLNNEQQKIRFLVNFPRGQPTPRISKIKINDKEFCPNSLTFSDTRAQISLQYTMKTGVEYPVARGDQFRVDDGSTPDAQQVPSSRPEPARQPYVPPSQRPYVPPTQPPYVRPTQRPYVPPTQRPYVPPTQRPYVPPTQRPYVPPTQPPYVPPTQPPYVPTQPPYVNPLGQLSATRQPPRRENQNTDDADTNAMDVVPDGEKAVCSTQPAETVLCLLRCEQLSDNLNAKIQRRDTIKAVFPPDKPLPPPQQLQHWAHATLKLKTEDVSLFQVDKEVATVFIKLNDLELGERLLNDIGQSTEFTYENGTSLKVILTFSGYGYRHIQLFNLPIEVPPNEIADAIERYGPIINIYEETWNNTFRFKVKNGVRKVYMFVEKHIPSYVIVAEYRAFVTYEGQPGTCECDASQLRRECHLQAKPNEPSLHAPLQ